MTAGLGIDTDTWFDTIRYLANQAAGPIPILGCQVRADTQSDTDSDRKYRYFRWVSGSSRWPVDRCLASSVLVLDFALAQLESEFAASLLAYNSSCICPGFSCLWVSAETRAVIGGRFCGWHRDELCDRGRLMRRQACDSGGSDEQRSAKNSSQQWRMAHTSRVC